MEVQPLPPFLFAAKTQADRRRLARLKEVGRVRQIGPRLYTSLPELEVADATRRSWSAVVSGLFPGALVSHRSALEYVASPDGVVFLTSSTNRKVSYPGLEIEFVRGPRPLQDDGPFLSLRASSLSRAFLENLSRDARSAHSRTVPIETLEKRLEQLLADGGEDELNRIRDRAREIAADFGWRAEFERLDGIIGALHGTRSSDHVTGPSAKARATGEPFDPRCLERLQLLYGELRTRSLLPVSDPPTSAQHFGNKAFFEAYFSNYIEGTTFEIEEAEQIVFDKRIPKDRPIDAHDIVGTFDVVSDPTEMRRTPGSAGELLALLQGRHRTMLRGRLDVQPGSFKTKVNRAGGTSFVGPEEMLGTLKKGYELYESVAPGLSRAIFIQFLVSDVHPFNDGNGRLARVMMNAELVAVDAATIIIPTVYRDDYLQALRALTRRNRPKILVDMLSKAASFSNLDFSDYPRVLADLQRRNWFRDHDEARIITDVK